MGSQAQFAVSVVIPTRGRETRLAFALDSLAVQTLDPGAFEVIVVRDGDDEPQRAEVPDRLNCRILTLPGRATPSAKRNAGWRESGGEMIAFTDDDCRPSSGWLAGLLSAAAATPGALIVQGRVSPDPDEMHLLTGLARSLTVDGADGWFPTANLALPRSLLRELGGFDETLAYGEDTDLGLRGTAAGARAVFAPEALVWHAVHTRNILSARGDTARAAEVAKVIRRHPAQRRRIFLRLFWKRSHAMALLALAGICMARRRPRAAALAVAPYAIENYDTGVAPSARHLAAVAVSMPARLLLDLRETAATVAGAIRARTPLV